MSTITELLIPQQETGGPRFYKFANTGAMAGGPKDFGGTKGMLLYFWRPGNENCGDLNTLLVLPNLLFCPLKFCLWFQRLVFSIDTKHPWIQFEIFSFENIDIDHLGIYVLVSLQIVLCFTEIGARWINPNHSSWESLGPQFCYPERADFKIEDC